MSASGVAEPIVVLLPGLWMPAWVMIPLERRIARCGLRTTRFGYASVRAGLEQNSSALARFVEGLAASRVHLVGHSLGGVLALHATASRELRSVRRIVALGPPFADSYAARQLGRCALGRWMMGICVPQWLACERSSVPAGVELGVLAGTVAFGLGTLVAPDLPRPHDGVISVAETAIEGMKTCVQTPVSHSGMLVSNAVAARVCNFLLNGSFEDASAPYARPAA